MINFFWMEKRFGMLLREGLDIWPDFIELCERRNLLTHTGGVVSDQYLQNCADYGRNSVFKVGEKLNVDLDYLVKSIGIITEIGCKLIHTMWRKFAPDQRSDADSHLNGFGMDLIAAKEFDTTIKILEFGVNQKQHSSDLCRRMMVVNLANALKLGGNLDRCNRVLSKHDWSATSYQFQICVAAVRDNFEEVCRFLKMGEDVTGITPSNFRDWPVFLEARKQQMVQEAFETVFGEELFRSEAEPSKD
jgi:hypothetical protein